MTTDDVQEGTEPMIVSTQTSTPDENDSQAAERVLVVTRWLGAHHGPLDRIVLPREPASEEERLWVETELRTRLVPGGRIEVADENGSQTVLGIDVTPIPQPPVDHYLELEGDDGIRATLVCKSAPGAACRMVHDCQCEEYCACEPPSRLVDSGECNHANWINGGFDAQCESKAGTRILVPVETSWDDDRFVWEFVPGITK